MGTAKSKGLPRCTAHRDCFAKDVYKRQGKTLCSLYAKSNCVGFIIIFGKDERAKFEDIRDMLSDSVCKRYDEAQTSVSYTHLRLWL